MNSLNGLISPSDLELVRELVDIRFSDKSIFRNPESLILYEQSLLEESLLLEYCEKSYGRKLFVPQKQYLAKEIISHFSESNCVPLSVDTVNNRIKIGIIPEFENEYVPNFRHYGIEKFCIPLYHYVAFRTSLYSVPEFLNRLPEKDLFQLIVSEAISCRASDITITQKESEAVIYYMARKKKIYSKRLISKMDADNIIKLMADIAKSPLVATNTQPRYMSLNLNSNHRGRMVINNTIHGLTASVRVFTNESFQDSLEDLNHDDKTIGFIRNIFNSKENGLRLLIGATSSGKNTTILAALNEKVAEDKFKIVSVEKPVEILLESVEQINAETEEDYQLNVESLLRQNPDIVYASEITDGTAKAILNLSNTAKPIYSSLHANSIADVVTRLQDLTGFSTDRIVMNLQSAIFQELVRIEEEDKLYPRTRCLYFSEELKQQLFGKSLGEVYSILKREESAWNVGTI